MKLEKNLSFTYDVTGHVDACGLAKSLGHPGAVIRSSGRKRLRAFCARSGDEDIHLIILLFIFCYILLSTHT